MAGRDRPGNEPRTETAGARVRDRVAHLTRSDLLVALDGAHPLRDNEPVALAGVHRVVLGRGDAPSVERRQNGARWEIEVRLEDSQVSREHAVLERSGGVWTVRDLGSRNGTLVEGRLRSSKDAVALEDGATIQIGRTLLVLREVAAADAGAEGMPGFLTASPSLRARLDALRRVVEAEAGPVLVRGPSGTGKEVVARAVHAQLARRGRTGRFIAVNCAALPANLVEAELFGARRGAYTGATEDREGLVRAAHRGTLFLDEIGDLAPTSQAALLRVLQEKEVRPVGATTAVGVDVFVIAATHRDLDAMMEAGTFRSDLYARLAGFELALPPLEERIEDLGPLVAAVLERKGSTGSLSSEAVKLLGEHDWPLNVRQLEMAIAQALALAGDGPIEAAHLPPALREPSTAAAAKDDEPGGEDALRDELRAALALHGGNVSAAARAMGKNRRQLHRWIARFGLDLDSFRSSGSP